MRFHHVLPLLQKGMYTIGVVFHSGNTYTYKVPTSVKLKTGDQVVVPTPLRFAIATVVAVHSTPQFDFELPCRYKWIVQKLDVRAYDARVAADELQLRQLENEQDAQRSEGKGQNDWAITAFAAVYPKTAGFVRRQEKLKAK